MEATTGNRAAKRIAAVTTLSDALYGELKTIAGQLKLFSEDPASNAVSPSLMTLQRVAAFCGFWGVANFLGGLRELASEIERVPVLEVERSDYRDRINTFATGVNALGQHLRDTSAGAASSYSALNEHFARILRKARPQLLEKTTGELLELTFMAAPASLEVEAYWSAAPRAGRDSLIAALKLCGDQQLSDDILHSLAFANPYRSLAGFFGALSIAAAADAPEELMADATAELQRLLVVLQEEDPVVPPTPAAFVFSRLMYAIATSSSDEEGVQAIRTRYSLVRPQGEVRSAGGEVMSMFDLARKFAASMGKFREHYQQAMIANTPATILRLAEAVNEEAPKLKSRAFAGFAQQLLDCVRGWKLDSVTEEEWTHGAALLLLLQQTAEAWGNQGIQDDLDSVLDRLVATGKIPVCPPLQVSTRNAAIKQTCLSLQDGFTQVTAALESAMRPFQHHSMSAAQILDFNQGVGHRASQLLDLVTGFCWATGLVRGESLAAELKTRILDGESIFEAEGRAAIFDGVSRLSLFIGRLRPASMLDLQPDEAGEAMMTSNEAAPIRSETADVVETESMPRVEHACEQGAEQSDAADEASTAEHEHFVQELEERGAAAVESSYFTAAEVLDTPPPVETPFVVSNLEPSPTTAAVRSEELDLGPPQDLHAQADDDLFPDDDAFPHDDSFEDALIDAVMNGRPAEGKDAVEESELIARFLGAAEGREDRLNVDDGELMKVMFEESDQCLADIRRGLDAWTSSDGGALIGTVSEIRRHVHTLKGVCRTCGLDGVGAVLHAMEDRLELTRDDGIDLAQDLRAHVVAIAAVQDTMDHARVAFEQGGDGLLPEISAGEGKGRQDSEPTAQEEGDVAAGQRRDLGASDHLIVDHGSDSQQELKMAPPEQTPATPMSSASRESSPILAPAKPVGSVRVPLAVAARVGHASSQLLSASRKSLEHSERAMRALREVEANVRRMTPVLRDLEIFAATNIASGASGSSQGFDALELDRHTSLQEMTRRLREAADDTFGALQGLSESLRANHGDEQDRVELTDELQRESSSLTLVGVASQQARLNRVVTKACEDAGKSAVLSIEPGCRIPAAAIDKVVPVLEHILRNAIAHGIERPEARQSRGKHPQGSLVLGSPVHAGQDASVVRIAVRDDGAGIDHAKVLELAQRKGLAPNGQSYSDEAIREFLFMPGFSTASAVSELAGRGVGLDVVRSSIAELGGQVAVSSSEGQGAEFVLTIPSDTTTMAVVPVVSGGYRCLLPLTLISRIVPVSSSLGVQLAEDQRTVSIDGASFELIDLGTRVPAGKRAVKSGRGHLVLMSDTGLQKAVLVDAIGTQTRVVVRKLGPYVRDISGLVAGTMLAGGELMLVVNPLRLQEVAPKQPLPTAAEGMRRTKLIMVVDDSTTVRLSTSRFLKRIGFDAVTAKDGLDALHQISKGVKPDGFCFDLEMPGMDGFELIAAVRRSPDFASTPIVVISSRIGAKYRDRAQALGANAYLGKPHEEAHLQQVLAALVGTTR